MKLQRSLVLALALGSSACQGVPVDQARYEPRLELLEVPAGVVVLPFGLALDMVLSLVGSVAMPGTTLAFSLMNPLCNAIVTTPTEVAFLEEGVIATPLRVSGELRADAGTVRQALAAALTAAGYRLEAGDDPVRVRTLWLAEDLDKPAEKRVVPMHSRVLARLYPPERPGQPVRLRVRIQLAGSASDVVSAELSRKKRWDLENAQPDPRAGWDPAAYESEREFHYRMKGRSTRSARRKADDDVEEEELDLEEEEEELEQEVEDAHFVWRRETARALLGRIGPDPLPAIWADLKQRFDGRDLRP